MAAKPQIWLNGKLLQNAEINAASAGLTLGWGVFTTLAIHQSRPIFFERHFARLARDAHSADVPLLWTARQIEAGLTALMLKSGVQNGLARLTVTRRDDGRWNCDTGADFSILVQPGAAGPADGLKLQVSPYRAASRRPLAGIKTTSYLPYFWAWREAHKAGFDEALVLCGEEKVCEGKSVILKQNRERERQGRLMRDKLDEKRIFFRV